MVKEYSNKDANRVGQWETDYSPLYEFFKNPLVTKLRRFGMGHQDRNRVFLGRMPACWWHSGMQIGPKGVKNNTQQQYAPSGRV